MELGGGWQHLVTVAGNVGAVVFDELIDDGHRDILKTDSSVGAVRSALEVAHEEHGPGT